jgi:hypothetical protein
LGRDTAPEEVLHIPPDHELEAEFAGDEVTPVVRVCQDCTGESIVLDNDVQPPALASEAFRNRRCRGTADDDIWRLCMSEERDDPYGPGLMTMPGQEGMRVLFDRRRTTR